MEPVTQLIILIFGFTLGFVLYEVMRYRVGGVVAIPIMVIYTFSNSILLPIFLYSIGVCLIVVSIITERTLLYGRRLLYVYMAISILVTSSAVLVVSSSYNIDLATITIGTIFPGIVAYNLSREAFDFESGLKSAFMMTWNFLVIFLFGLFLTYVIG